MQKEITTGGPLLDVNGELIEKGYARSLIKDYQRSDIKAGKLRIKEWDYYLVYDENYAIALTFDDNSYMGLMSLSVIDFKNQREKTVSPMQIMTKGKHCLPSSSKHGDCIYHSKNIDMLFRHNDGKRVLECKLPNFYDNKDFTCQLILSEEPKDSMVIVTPFDKPKYFYYNQKIVGFKVEGYFKVGDFEYKFSGPKTRGILDWGRGVWTYKNTWYWGAGAGIVDGHEIGFNIGYGFGDTSAASENCVFYDGVMHKLDQVTFNIPTDEKGKYEYTKPWTFTSNDGRFEMDFTPIIDRKSKTDVLLICSDQHQVFGKFNGKIILDDGKVIILRDFIAFAERVFNKW